MVLFVFMRNHCGMFLFCFCFFARIFFTRKVLLHGMLRARGKERLAINTDRADEHPPPPPPDCCVRGWAGGHNLGGPQEAEVPRVGFACGG